MIKICGCAFRKPGIEAAAWFDHYHERHGPLIASLNKYCENVAAYRQNYIDHDFAHLPADVPEAPGGVSELWYPDLDAAGRAFADADYLRDGRADEESFVDFSRGISLFGTERVIFDRSPSAAASWTREPRHRLFIFRASADEQRAAFQQAWQEAGARFVEQPWFASVCRYVQTHTLADSDRVRRPARHDILDEFQFASREAALAFARDTPAIAGEAARQLTDVSETLAVVGRSHLVLGR